MNAAQSVTAKTPRRRAVKPTDSATKTGAKTPRVPAKMDTRKLLAAMLRASIASAERQQAIELLSHARAVDKEQSEGVYTRAVKIAQAAATHAEFREAYEQYKEAVRADGRVIDPAARTAFSVLFNAWDRLAAVRGTDIVIRSRKGDEVVAVPPAANDIPELFTSFGRVRTLDKAAKGSEGAGAGEGASEEAAAEGKSPLPSALVSKLALLESKLRNSSEETAAAALDAALAFFLVGGKARVKKESPAPEPAAKPAAEPAA